MAIRYSGDVEIRMEYGKDGFYYTQIRFPGYRANAILSLREVGIPRLFRKINHPDFTSSEAYDTAAEAFIKFTEKNIGEIPIEVDDEGNLVIRRVFQSPCPAR